MNLLILHLQNVLQTLKVLLNVFIWLQSLLLAADNMSENYFYLVTAAEEANITSRTV